MTEKTKLVQVVVSIRWPHLLCFIYSTSWDFVDSSTWALRHLMLVVSCLFQGFSRAEDTNGSYSNTVNGNLKTKGSQCPWKETSTNALMEADALNAGGCFQEVFCTLLWVSQLKLNLCSKQWVLFHTVFSSFPQFSKFLTPSQWD